KKGTASRVDVATRSVADKIPLAIRPAALAAGGGWIWTTSVLGERVIRIDPVTGTVTKTVLLDGAWAGGLAFGDGGLWIANLTDNELIELDPNSGVQRRTIALPLQPSAFAIGNGTIWVADYAENKVVQVDLRTGNQ